MLGVSLIAQTAAVVLLVGIAVYDLRHMKIRNTAVLALLLLYLPAQGALGFPDLSGDLFAGVILFVFGLVLWFLKMLGAGDVKLAFPLGMHLGSISLLPFATLLCLLCLALFLAITVAHKLGRSTGVGGWLAARKTGGKVPFGPLLVMSAIPLLIARILWLA